MRPPLIPQTIPHHEQDSEITKLLKTLFNSLVEYRDPHSGRIVISLFMCLPSRKDFPEYFNIIHKPISMYEIRKRIESNQYRTEEACINDFKLMFNNCKTFNEDGSIIFEDSKKLEKIVLDKYMQLRPNGLANGFDSPHSKGPKSFGSNIVRTSTPNKLNYDHNKGNLGRPVTSSIASGKNHLNSSINNNLISQSSNGFPSEDSNSNSNNFSTSVINEDSLSEQPFHNEASMDSTASVVHHEKPKRSKRDSDAPKKRMLTGYIIYAAEVRKEYVDKNPNQDFGFISRLIGNDWKALPKDLKHKYEQRANVQNIASAKEAARLERIRALTPASAITPATPPSKKHKSSHNTNSKPALNKTIGTPTTMAPKAPATFSEATTQTTTARFVAPPTRTRFNYTEIYRRYLGEHLDITHEDVYGPQTQDINYSYRNNQHLEPETAEKWLGSGLGRHRSSGDALWALRDFMLQDADTMRWSLQPYQ